MSGRDSWYSNGREEYRPPGFPRQVSPIPIPSSSGHNHRAPPPASTASGSYSDEYASLASSTSTAPSMTPFDYGYEFSCEFGFLGCNLTFHPAHIDSYISHTASHFVQYPPPRKTCCIFCDRVYEASNDRVSTWRQRIRHIADHFRAGSQLQYMRPDFCVIEYMWKKGLLSDEDYDWAVEGTERPACDGLVNLGYNPREMTIKDERRTEEPYDQAKEDRHRRRKKDSRGKGREKQ